MPVIAPVAPFSDRPEGSCGELENVQATQIAVGVSGEEISRPTVRS